MPRKSRLKCVVSDVRQNDVRYNVMTDTGEEVEGTNAQQYKSQVVERDANVIYGPGDIFKDGLIFERADGTIYTMLEFWITVFEYLPDPRMYLYRGVCLQFARIYRSTWRKRLRIDLSRAGKKVLEEIQQDRKISSLEPSMLNVEQTTTVAKSPSDKARDYDTLSSCSSSNNANQGKNLLKNCGIYTSSTEQDETEQDEDTVEWDENLSLEKWGDPLEFESPLDIFNGTNEVMSLWQWNSRADTFKEYVFGAGRAAMTHDDSTCPKAVDVGCCADQSIQPPTTPSISDESRRALKSVHKQVAATTEESRRKNVLYGSLVSKQPRTEGVKLESRYPQYLLARVPECLDGIVRAGGSEFDRPCLSANEVRTMICSHVRPMDDKISRARAKVVAADNYTSRESSVGKPLDISHVESLHISDYGLTSSLVALGECVGNKTDPVSVTLRKSLDSLASDRETISGMFVPSASMFSVSDATKLMNSFSITLNDLAIELTRVNAHIIGPILASLSKIRVRNLILKVNDMPGIAGSVGKDVGATGKLLLKYLPSSTNALLLDIDSSRLDISDVSYGKSRGWQRFTVEKDSDGKLDVVRKKCRGLGPAYPISRLTIFQAHIHINEVGDFERVFIFIKSILMSTRRLSVLRLYLIGPSLYPSTKNICPQWLKEARNIVLQLSRAVQRRSCNMVFNVMKSHFPMNLTQLTLDILDDFASKLVSCMYEQLTKMPKEKLQSLFLDKNFEAKNDILHKEGVDGRFRYLVEVVRCLSGPHYIDDLIRKRLTDTSL